MQLISLSEELLADMWSLSCGPYTTEVVFISPGALLSCGVLSCRPTVLEGEAVPWVGSVRHPVLQSVNLAFCYQM